MVVVATVDRGRLRAGEIEGATPDEALQAFRPIRDLVHFDLVRDETGNIEMVEVPLPYPELTAVDVPVPEIAEVQALPQVDESWQFDALQLWTWVANEDEQPYRPYLVLIVNPAGPFVLLQELKKTDPSPAEVFHALLKAMSHPLMGAGNPRRPTSVVTDHETLAETLEPELAVLDIHCEIGETPELDAMITDLEYYLGGEHEPISGLLDDPRVTPEQVGELFEAAADFYRVAPWEWMLDEDLVALRYPVIEGRWRFISVMGNAGMEFGIAVFEDLFDYDMLASTPPEALIGMMNYRSLTYDDITAVPFSDLDALMHYGWEIAADDAYPIPLIFTQDEQVLRPSPEEIDWYTIALRTIVTFFEDYWPDEVGYVPGEISTILTVPLAGRLAEVELRFPADLATEWESDEAEASVYHFKVQIKRRKGQWRRIEILSTQTLADLDAMIRQGFDHDPMDHLGGFWIPGGRRQQDIDLATIYPFGGGENADMPIGALGIAEGDKLKYVYDFGDWIEHILTLEAVTEPERNVEYPRLTN
jgi:hypothetical protein